MFKFIIAIMAGRNSDFLAAEIASRERKVRVTWKERCRAGMSVIFPILLLATLLTSGDVFPVMKTIVDTGLDSNIYIQISIIFALGLGVALPLVFLLTRLPFFFTAFLFMTLVADFLMITVYRFINV